MLKFLGGLVLLTTVFGLGYYIGQRPVSELKLTISSLKDTIASLTRNVLDSTLGLEQNFRWRQSLVDAKAKMIQAKAEILDRNFGNAAKEVAEAVAEMEKAAQSDRSDPTDRHAQALKILIAKSKAVQLDLTMGKAEARKKLNEILREVDGLLAK